MKKVLLFLGVFCFLIIGILGFLGFTEKGVQQCVNIVSLLTAGNISVKDVSGTLLKGLKLDQIVVKTSRADITVSEGSFDWQPAQIKNREILVSTLNAHGVEVRLKDKEKVAGQKKSADVEPFALTLPVSFVLDQVDISNLTLRNPKGDQLTDIDKLAFGLNAATDHLCIVDLSLSSARYSGQFDGCLKKNDVWHIDANSNVTLIQETQPPISANLEIRGNVSEVIAKAELVTPSTARADIVINDIIEHPSWNAEVDVPLLKIEEFEQAGIEQGELELQASLTGDLNSYEGKLNGQIKSILENSFSFVVSLNGNSKGANLSSAVISSDYGSVNLTDSTIGWDDQISWDLRAAVENFHIVAGDSSISANGDISSIGSLILQKRIDGELIINSYTLNIDERVMTGDAKVSFNESSVSIEQFDITGKKGGFQLDGRFNFAENQFLFKRPLSWQVELKANEFDPSLILADYPGQINGEIVSTGSWDQNNLVGQAEIREVKGTVRDLPLRASGLVLAKDHLIEIRDLILISGDSEIDVNGTINDSVDLYGYIFSPDISQLVAGAAGTLDIRAVVKGKTDEPRIDLDIEGTAVEFSSLTVEHLTGTVHGHLSEDEPLEGLFTATGLTVNQREIDTVNISFDGTTASHRVDLQSETTGAALKLAIAGSLGEGRIWDGIISDTRLSLNSFGEWLQPGQTEMAVSAKGLTIEPFCLENGERGLCLDLGIDEHKSWVASADISNVDLELVNSLLGIDRLFHGMANGSLEASGHEMVLHECSVDLSLNDAGVADPEIYLWAEFLQFDTINVAASLVDQRVVGSIDVLGVRGNRLNGDIFIDNLYNEDLTPGEAELSGTLHLTGPNLSTVAPITAYYVYPTGTLTGDFGLSGSLFSPVAEGKLDLIGGQIDFPTFGATLHDVIFGLKWDQRSLFITGEGDSGEGRLFADGSLTFNPGDFYGEFNFTGEGIETFDLPEYEITTSPDLRLVFDTEGGILMGDLDVPKAVISPERMSNSLSQSGDVVFVDEEIDAEAGDWIFKILIGVNLGEGVKLDSFGIKGNLEGNLQVEKMGGNFTTGKGELTLQEGTFSIYGRSMDIERGRVFFSGGPIEDPGFDVRAQKVVSKQLSGAEGVKVGVDVSGTVENLEFNLFSDPHMEDSDILAYMVIGRPMAGSSESEENILGSAAMALGLNRGTGLIQGLTSILPVDDVYFEGDSSEEDVSLVVGKNLTKELFVGYDHNFFDQQGEVTIRYDLGNGFYVESRTSTEATGADILYSFER